MTKVKQEKTFAVFNNLQKFSLLIDRCCAVDITMEAKS